MTGWLLTRARLSLDRSRSQSISVMLHRAAATDAGHALVWSLFPQDQAQRDFLYREMTPGEFLIVSRIPPHDGLGLWQLSTREYAPDFVPGDRLVFSLRADIQISTPPQGDGPERSRGKREPLHVVAKRQVRPREVLARDWIAAQLPRHGARLLSIPPNDDPTRDPDTADAPPRDRLQISIEKQLRLTGGSRTGSLQSALFDGVLEVTEPAAFTSLLTSGLGRSRAYGCGLLLVRRA
jgi:CRISPR system Cascade subunit CasE